MPKFSYQPKIILFKIKIVTEKSLIEESYTMNFLNQGKTKFFSTKFSQ